MLSSIFRSYVTQNEATINPRIAMTLVAKRLQKKFILWQKVNCTYGLGRLYGALANAVDGNSLFNALFSAAQKTYKYIDSLLCRRDQ